MVEQNLHAGGVHVPGAGIARVLVRRHWLFFALAIFMVGILLSMLGTAIAGSWRGGYPMWAVLNLAGIVGLYLTARVANAARRLDRRAPRLPV